MPGESVFCFSFVSILFIWFGIGSLQAKGVEEEVGVQVHLGIL